MKPTQFHAKQEQHDGRVYVQPPPLKIKKDSNTFIPHSSSTGSSTSNDLTNKPQQQQQTPPRLPVIIHTHSPKVIHTHPRDFMALVQKLTGYTPPPEETKQIQDPRNHHRGQGNIEDNESANSVVTEEHGPSVNDVPHVNSCFVDNGVGIGVGTGPQSYRESGFDNTYFNPNMVFSTNPTDFLCSQSHQLQFYNPDSMFMNQNSLRVLKDYPNI